MEHFPVNCTLRQCIKQLTITDNKKRINISVLTHMWGYFTSQNTNLEFSTIDIYKNIAKPLFEELIKHYHSQIICTVITEANDEKGITLIKDGDTYFSLDTANKLSFVEVTKNMCKQAKRILIIELFTCKH
jgi:hypothetical protein